MNKVEQRVERIYIGEIVPLRTLQVDIFLVDFVEISSEDIRKHIDADPDFATMNGSWDFGGLEPESTVLVYRMDNTKPPEILPHEINWAEKYKGTILEDFHVPSHFDQ